MNQPTRIALHFHPYKWNEKNHAVEKTKDGVKRKFLCGVSSGIQEDFHGECMTENCIKSFHRQASSGDILMYEGQHGVNYTDDLGRLNYSDVLKNGDWYTEYMLHDPVDGFSEDSVTIERATKLWKQSLGLAPYTKPRQKGFSIEGEVPENGILKMDSSGKRVLDDVELDGVVVVPRPAYKDSIATAVFKALGVIPPDVAKKVQKDLRERLHERVRQNQEKDNFYQHKFLVEDELERAITEIMSDPHKDTTEEKLRILFTEYGDLMTNLILQNGDMFRQPDLEENGMVRRNSDYMRVLKMAKESLNVILTKRGIVNDS